MHAAVAGNMIRSCKYEYVVSRGRHHQLLSGNLAVFYKWKVIYSMFSCRSRKALGALYVRIMIGLEERPKWWVASHQPWNDSTLLPLLLSS